MTQLNSLSDVRDYASIQRLADESGVSRRTIARIIAERNVPSITLAGSIRYSRQAFLEALR